MSRKLQSYVHVAGAVYGPGDAVPTDVAELITNPNAWAESKGPTDAPTEVKAARPKTHK